MAICLASLFKLFSNVFGMKSAFDSLSMEEGMGVVFSHW